MTTAANVTTTTMSEDRMVDLVRNALLIAGHEMGAEGDHWPVIKSTIHTLMQDWEDLKIERNVSAELQIHYKAIIDEIENNLHLCPTALRPKAEKMIRNLRELHRARFETVADTMFVVCDADAPIHIGRIEQIINTLSEEENANVTY